MSRTTIAKYSMMKAARLIREISGRIGELDELVPNLPATEAASFVRELAEELIHGLYEGDATTLAFRLDEEVIAVEEDVAAHGLLGDASPKVKEKDCEI